MAKNILQVNYDELNAIAKKFKDEGEDAFKLHSATRQRVRDLHKEWIGEAAEKFFDEMENELLPALQRLSKALHFSQDVVSAIMKIVYEADEDTANFFRGDFSGDDFGAGAFQGALGGVPGGQGTLDDFGAGKFDDALGGFSTGDIAGGSSGPDDFGAGKFEEALPPQGGGETGGGQTDSSESGGSDNQAEEETVETDIPAGGGGGGSSSPSQGLKGDLKGMGVGMGQVQQNASAGGPTVGGAMTDHVYSEGDSSESVGGESQTPSGSPTKSSEQSSSDSGGPAAAGAAGAAAAGGAAKGIKSRKKKNN